MHGTESPLWLRKARRLTGWPSWFAREKKGREDDAAKPGQANIDRRSGQPKPAPARQPMSMHPRPRLRASPQTMATSVAELPSGQPVRHGGRDPRVRPNSSAAAEVRTVAFVRSARDVWPLGQTGGPYRRAGARPMEGGAVEQPTSSPRAAQATTVRPARRASVGGGRGPREAISVRPGRRPMGGAQPACTVVRRFPHQNAEIRTVSRAKHGARLRTVSDRLASRPRLAPPAGAPLLLLPCGRRPRRAHGREAPSPRAAVGPASGLLDWRVCASRGGAPQGQPPISRRPHRAHSSDHARPGLS